MGKWVGLSERECLTATLGTRRAHSPQKAESRNEGDQRKRLLSKVKLEFAPEPICICWSNALRFGRWPEHDRLTYVW
jgi:hypothetical protein